MVLHLLKDSSKDDTAVQWKWWDQHNRKALWYRALTRQEVSIQKRVLNDHLFNQTTQSNQYEIFFVLWIHCIDWEGYECMMSEMELRCLYDTWNKWSGYGVSFAVSEQCPPS